MANLIVRGHGSHKFDVNVSDLFAAIVLLEKATVVESWEIKRIANPLHVIPPAGLGFGITVYKTEPGRTPVMIWAKAGSDCSIKRAAEIAIARLRQRLAQGTKDDGPVGQTQA